MTGSPWWALEVQADAEQRDRVSAWLVRQTGQAVEERDDGTLVSFAPDAAAAEALAAALAAFAGPLRVERRRLDHVDWSVRWRDGLGPRTFGRLTVMPSWSAKMAAAAAPVSEPAVVQPAIASQTTTAPADDAKPTVVLDPETAFGSGEHGSTRAALTLLERRLTPGARVLDLGSGSGILAIAAVKLGAAWAIGIEIDAGANDVARRNAERNGVMDRVEFLTGEAGDLAPLAGPADLALSNILRTVNVALLPAMRAALAPAGLAIFSGMERAEADAFRPALAASGWAVRDETVDGEWWAVAATASGAATVAGEAVTTALTGV